LLDTFVTPTLYDQISGSVGTVAEVEKLLLPILHPKSDDPLRVDLSHVQRDIRFRSWIRNLYLNAKYSKTEVMKNAETDLSREQLEIPSFGRLVKIFNLEKWNRHPEHKENELQLALMKALRNDCVTVYDWSLEDVLECIGCCVVGLNEFNVTCEKMKIYDYVTKEYISQLSTYLYKRSREIKKEKGKDKVTILEVGAGSGRLGSSLKSEIERKRKKELKIELIMTDLGTWKLPVVGKYKDQVLRMDYKQAVEEFNPDIILCSWMPLGEDWSWCFRHKETVSEYILMGETDDGCCGHKWLTWGYRENPEELDSPFDFKHDEDKSEYSLDFFDWVGRQFKREKDAILNKYDAEKINTTPYEMDGFSRNLLEEPSMFQICRYDKEQYAANSKTVSFKRE